MTTLLDYAQLSGRVYNRTDENRTPLTGGWSELQWLKDNPITGFSAGVYRKGNDVVISFAGTNESLLKDFDVANIPAGLGLGSPQIFQAAKLVLDVMAANPGASISFTGHSLGGGLASVMAVFFDLQATVFDPAPFELSAKKPEVLSMVQMYLAANGYSNSAFNTYALSLGTLFLARESNVQSRYLAGEALEYLRFIVPVITGSGLETRESIGAQTADMVTLHSMTLLNAILLSDAFKQALTQQTRAVEVFSDSTLYARDPQKSTEPDFLNKMLNQQLISVAGGASSGILHSFIN
jgi:hypothetical protein